MSNSVIEYYTNNHNEAMRHNDPFGIIQELRTKELISRYLNDSAMSVLDVGGATGVYSFFLADLGHKVSMLDIVPNHIEHVENLNCKRDTKLHSIILGDAQTFETTEEYDGIILHGPLYHIIDRKKRIAVLRRMKNYLKRNGLILGFGINRYAGYFYGVRSGYILDTKYREFVTEEIKTGVRTRKPGWHFHRPDEMIAEYEEAGLCVVDIKSVVTQIWMLPGIEALIKEPANMKEILDLAKDMEDEIEIGQDFLCVGKK
jgi:2-polyprenyl-3-methyl-5-hydroxy-6-metoxy-1,4-benzoquinol methylase